METMRVGIGVEQKSVCSECGHSLTNHIITADRNSQIVNGKCKSCQCDGTLSID